jgi:hypothetical protein
MDWKTIQEILKDGWSAISAAPIPVLGLVFFASLMGGWLRGWIHHGKVEALEERLKLAKDQEAAGVDLAAAQSQAKPDEGGLEIKAVTKTDQQLDPMQRPNVPPLVRDREVRIRTDLAKLQLNEKPRKAVDLLIEHLATAQLLHAAEQLYRRIFGSQVAVLKHLNLVVSATEEKIAEFYDSASSQYPELYSRYPSIAQSQSLSARPFPPPVSSDQSSACIAARWLKSTIRYCRSE